MGSAGCETVSMPALVFCVLVAFDHCFVYSGSGV